MKDTISSSILSLLRHAALLAVPALPLHYAWENVQCRLFFVHRANPADQWSMLLAAGGDLLLTWIAYLVVATLTGCWLWLHERWTARVWIILLGTALALSISIELHALATQRWEYTAINPRIPGLGVSVVPILQLLILFPVTFGLVRIWVRSRVAQAGDRR
ncbi:MAG TPA: hypothetical protein VLA26_03210 [Gammaproteobacteria bacterium]|nr:hypothetical protein [Gammaproteobacteria bacterium]